MINLEKELTQELDKILDDYNYAVELDDNLIANDFDDMSEEEHRQSIEPVDESLIQFE